MMIGEVLAYLAVIGTGGLILFVYGRRPSEPIGPSLLLLLGALFLWALGELLRLYVAETPSSYWYALVLLYSGVLLVTPAWWLLALAFAEIHGRPLRWVGFKLRYAPLGFAAVLWGVVLTNPLHGQFLVPRLHEQSDYRIGWYVLAGMAYFLLLAVFVLFLWLRWSMRHSAARGQLNIMVLASLIPTVCNVLWVTNTVNPSFDITVSSFVVSIALILYGIYRHQLFVLRPTTLRHLFHADRDGLLILDRNDLLLHANPAAAEFFNGDPLHSHAEVLPMLAQRLSSPNGEQASTHAEQFIETLLTPSKSENGHVYRFEHPSRHWLRIDATRIPGRRGNAIGTGIRLIDVTESKRAEETLRKSEQRFCELTDLLPLGVYEIDAEGIVTFANRSTLANLGYTADEMIGKLSAFQTVAPEDRDRRAANARRRMSGEDIGPQELTILRKDGSKFPAFTNSVLIKVDGKIVGLRGFVLDITDRKRAEDALIKAQEEAEERSRQQAAEEERRNLARDLHDAVSQTLFSASMMAESLPRIWEQMDASAVKDGLGQIERLSRGALAEMRTLLLELRPGDLDRIPLSRLVQQLTDALSARTSAQVTVELREEHAIPNHAKKNLYRIAQEALNNVVKHAKATTIDVTLESDAHSVILVVRDNGCGFNKLDVTPNHLGLSIMRERAESFGGTYSVDSSPGHGTAITVTCAQTLKE